MSKGHVWTFTSTNAHDSSEEIQHYPTWLVWTSLEPMRDFIIKTAWDNITEGFDRGLNDNELISIRDQIHDFIKNVVGPGRENELTITLDNHGEEEDYMIVRVWSMSIQ